eukprot:TRINITY_DN3727_c0_g1_i1.p1 TRINITY_DN3727_c0_g1~~TRINITY_DN3727_c0_g1_i1.p1  ORF type:complete len:532 (-),score=94.17 TRINITY_DN3727_c0_g1_i1:3458-5053(-)
MDSILASVCCCLLLLTSLCLRAELAHAQRINFDITAPSRSTYTPIVPSFRDVTARAGIDTRFRWKKYGSPSVADLDRDGFPDLLFCHHDSGRPELYFNKRDGTFAKSDWGVWRDNHGLSPFPITARERGLYFTLSVGGNKGRKSNHPFVYAVDASTRKVQDVSKAVGITYKAGRGRSALFMDLSLRKHPFWPDVIFTNAKAPSGGTQFAYENVGSKKFKLRALKGGIANDINWYATVTDLNNDGVMEVITYWQLRIWRLVAPFHFKDISDDVLPSNMKRGGVVSVAEIDFDNDGDFDLYVARTKSGDLKWSPGNHFDDYLFRNDNGVYVDVTDAANIPRGTTARGVTVADFNNDGHMDIFVSQYIEADIMLLNRGDGTFERVDSLISRASGARGDNAQAIDYNDDGRMDIISSEGDQHDVAFRGSYELFRNTLPNAWYSRYLKVRVGNAPDGSATPLHAVVSVVVGGGERRMVRRVGTAGAAVSKSYVETVHFGLGLFRFADSVEVVWTSGYKMTRAQRTWHTRTITMGSV